MTEAENVKKPNESEVQQKVGELADKLISYVNDSLTSVEVEAASMYGCNSAEELYEKLCYDKESIVVAALDDVICYIIADLTNMASAYQKHHQSVEKKTSFQNVQKEGVRVGTYNRQFVINEYKSEEQRITRFTQKLKTETAALQIILWLPMNVFAAVIVYISAI